MKIIQTTKQTNMKKLIITCTFIAFGAVASFAQQAANSPAKPQRPQMTPEQREQREKQGAERMSQAIAKQYNLNGEQSKGIYDASMSFIKKMEDLRANGKQPTRDEMEKMMDERDEAFKKVMTPEQYAKYAATRNKMPHSAAQQQQMQQQHAPAKN